MCRKVQIMKDWKERLKGLVLFTDGDGVSPDFDVTLEDCLEVNGLEFVEAFIETLLEEEREKTVDKILLKISDMEIEKAGNSAHTKHQIEVLIDNWYAKEREEYLNPSNSMELK